MILRWPGQGLSSEALTTRFRRGDPLCLPLADEGSLGFGNVGQQLQNDVCDQGPRQVPVRAGVQEGHIEDYDCGHLLLGDHPPLFQDLVIVPAQPIDGFDYHDVARPELG